MSDDTETPMAMTPNRPYLLRAMYDWIADNHLTPYVLVDAGVAGVEVPPQAVHDGRVVLNLDMQAVASLDLGNDHVSFKARFSGVSQLVRFPVVAVLAIYAQENGQGMMFADEGSPPPDGPPPPDDDTKHERSDKPGKSGTPHLRVIK